MLYLSFIKTLKPLIIWAILLVSLLQFTSGANAGEGPNVLMFGATLNDLKPDERKDLTEYNVIERPFIAMDKMKDLIKQVNPSKIIIRQPSGGIYEYSPNGSLRRQLQMQDATQNAQDKQKKGIGEPRQINTYGGNMAGNSMNGREVMLNNSPNPYIYGNSNQGQNTFPPYNAIPMGPLPVNTPIPYRERLMFGPYGSKVPVSQPYLPPCPPTMPQPMMSPNGYNQSQVFNPTPSGNFQRPLPPNLSIGMGQGNNMLASNNMNMQAPFPGANVPNYLYPGRSEYSYLPGEGEVLPKPGLSTGRQVVKQLASLAQNTAYPFWFDSYLTTDSNSLGSLTANTGTNAGFPALQFNANTTANSAIVLGQLFTTGLGVASTIADAGLDGVALRARRSEAVQQANGTPYYYYPDAAWSYYQALPYQPMQNSPVGY